MRPIIIETIIVDEIELENIFRKFEKVDDVVSLENDKFIVTYSPYESTVNFYESEKKTRKQISLPISIFTTAYGRIHITKYINFNKNKTLGAPDTTGKAVNRRLCKN